MEELEERVSFHEVLSVFFSGLNNGKGRRFRLGASTAVAGTIPSQGLSALWGAGPEESENKVHKTRKYCVN